MALGHVGGWPLAIPPSTYRVEQRSSNMGGNDGPFHHGRPPPAPSLAALASRRRRSAATPSWVAGTTGRCCRSVAPSPWEGGQQALPAVPPAGGQHLVVYCLPGCSPQRPAAAGAGRSFPPVPPPSPWRWPSGLGGVPACPAGVVAASIRERKGFGGAPAAGRGAAPVKGADAAGGGTSQQRRAGGAGATAVTAATATTACRPAARVAPPKRPQGGCAPPCERQPAQRRIGQPDSPLPPPLLSPPLPAGYDGGQPPPWPSRLPLSCVRQAAAPVLPPPPRHTHHGGVVVPKPFSHESLRFSLQE